MSKWENMRARLLGGHEVAITAAEDQSRPAVAEQRIHDHREIDTYDQELDEDA